MRSDRWTRAVLVGALALGLLAVTPLGGNALEPGGSFGDDDGSVHEASIEAIADVGITLGCNPPVNDLYCPNQSVTREQMATFLVRALSLPAGSSVFTDTAGSVHEANIAALADAGITVGCNPPANDMFCPKKSVTRAQMATFLVRALSLAPASGSFADTAGSVHEANIGALAAAGITQGCNPPVNDLFCPDKSVTRAQMATFLTRALNLDPMQPPPPLPAESPSPLVVIGTDNWLYYTVTVVQDLLSDSVRARTDAELDKVAKIVETSGRSFVYAFPPNKAVIYSETVPSSVWDGSNADLNSAAMRTAVNTGSDLNRVDLWSVFAAAATGEEIYFKHDTHWNSLGALLASEHIAALAAPGVWSQMDIVPTPASRRGDLADIISVTWVEEYDDPIPALSGVTPVVTIETADIFGRPLVSYASPGHPELSAVATVVIHDSAGLFFRNKLGPLFQSVTFVPMYSHPIPDDVRPYVVDSEQVILEVVERNLARDFVGTGTAGHMAATLADDFTQTSVGFVRNGDIVDFAIPAGSSGDLRYLIVVADVSSTVTLHDLNEVDIPASAGAWPNEMSSDASRYGFELVESAASTLQISLPAASVNVTDAFVVVVE